MTVKDLKNMKVSRLSNLKLIFDPLNILQCLLST